MGFKSVVISHTASIAGFEASNAYQMINEDRQDSRLQNSADLPYNKVLFNNST